MIKKRTPFLFSAVAILAVTSASGADAPGRPHVLLILADDLGWGDLSCYGNRPVETPELDRLAREGLRFTQFYAAAPICSPSRCGLITGQYPGRWRITSFLQTRAGNRVLRPGRLPRSASPCPSPCLPGRGLCHGPRRQVAPRAAAAM